MVEFEDFIGKNTTPASKVTSGVVSIIILTLLFFNIIPGNWQIWTFFFLIFHLINHITAALMELKIYVCPRCKKSFASKKSAQNHKCNKLYKSF